MTCFFSGQISTSLWLCSNPCTSREILELKGAVGCFNFPVVVAFGHSHFSSLLHCTPLDSVGISFCSCIFTESLETPVHIIKAEFSLSRYSDLFLPGSGVKPMSKHQAFSQGFQQFFASKGLPINSESRLAVSLGQAWEPHGHGLGEAHRNRNGGSMGDWYWKSHENVPLVIQWDFLEISPGKWMRSESSRPCWSCGLLVPSPAQTLCLLIYLIYVRTSSKIFRSIWLVSVLTNKFRDEICAGDNYWQMRSGSGSRRGRKKVEECRKGMRKDKWIRNERRARLGEVGELLIKERLYFLLWKKENCKLAYVLVPLLLTHLTLGSQAMLTAPSGDSSGGATELKK